MLRQLHPPHPALALRNPRPRLMLTLLVLLFLLPARANERAAADSLIRLLPSLPADSIKVYIYRDIAYYLQGIDPDSAMHYSRLGERLARILDQLPGRIWNLNQQGIAWEGMDRFDSAVATYQRALDLARQAGEPTMAGQMINTLGAAWYYQGNFTEAIARYTEALDLFERSGDLENAARSLNNLGVIFRNRRHYARAVDIYHRSLALKERVGDQPGMAASHYNLGLAYSHMEDHARSLHHFDRARDLLVTLDDQQELKRALVGRGMALHMLGDTVQSRALLNEALLGLAPRDVVERASALLHLGLMDGTQGRAASGLARMRMALALVEQSGRLDLLRSIHKELAQACAATGDDPCASRHWHGYALLSDSLAGEQQQWAIEEMRTKYEVHDKESTIRLQQLALAEERAQRRTYLATASLLVLLLGGSTAYAYSRVKLNRRLEQANATAHRALHERELLLKEMHHRVKNNLQMLNSLLSIQSRALSDPNAREAMRRNRERVQAIGLIHQFLYTRDSFRQIDMPTYLQRLLEHLSDAFELDQLNIALHAVTTPLQLDVDLATPVGLIVNELVTNAIKHAFDERGGMVVVTLQHSGNEVVLQVQDNGRGMPQGEPMQGFGHILLDTLAHRLHATMEPGNGQGTCHTLRFPLHTSKHEHVEHPGGRG
jgi:two-component sensor histidine kinase